MYQENEKRKCTCCLLKYPSGKQFAFVHTKKKAPKTLYRGNKKNKILQEIKDARDNQKERAYDQVKVFHLSKGFSGLGIKSNWKYKDSEYGESLNSDDYGKKVIAAFLEYMENNPERAQLVLHMLSGQVYRKLKDAGVWEAMIRPILQVKVKSNVPIYDFMKQTAERFCRDWTGKTKYLKFCLPVFLPVSMMAGDREEDHYIADKNVKKNRNKLICPAYYMDTTVVLYCRMLGIKKAEQFAFQNQDCVLVLCGKVPSKLVEQVCETLEFETLEGENLACFTQKNFEILKDFTERFGEFISDEQVIEIAQKAKEELNHLAEKVDMARAIDKTTKLLYLTMAVLMKKCLRWLNRCEITKELDLLCSQFYHSILPGYYIPHFEDVSVQTIPLTEENFEEAFQTTVRHMLDDLSKYVFLPQGEECLSFEEMEREGKYGFLRGFEIDKIRHDQIPSVLFYKESFVKRFAESCPYHCDDPQIIYKLVNRFSAAGKWKYCPKRKQSKDRFSGETTVASVRLLIEQLDFLSEEKRQELQKPFAKVGKLCDKEKV